MEQPMVSNRHIARGSRFAWGLACICAAVFALGVFIGYHSIYRNNSVAMLPPPPAMSPL
jgi:hypothetical protein